MPSKDKIVLTLFTKRATTAKRKLSLISRTINNMSVKYNFQRKSNQSSN
jgi:hypothetical protein